MIVSFVNCLDNYLPEGYRSDSLLCKPYWAAAEMIVRALQGETATIDYRKFSDAGLLIQPLIPRLDNVQIELFLWSNFVDAKGDFFDIDGMKLRPLTNPSIKQFWEITAEDIDRRDAWLAKNGYQKLPLLDLSQLRQLWLEVDKLLLATSPKAIKALVFYDYTRIRNTTLLTNMQETQAEMISVLKPLGWETFQLPKNFPKLELDDNWAHYDTHLANEFMSQVYQECGIIKEEQ